MDRYFLHAGHLGDCWAYMNYLLDVADGKPIIAVSPNPDRVEWYRRIYDLLEHDDCISFEVSGDYRRKLGKQRMFVDRVYHKVKKQYTQTDNTIAYSITARSFNEQDLHRQLTGFVGDVEEYKYIECGLPMEIEEIVDILSRCTLYVGIDNGVSHLARSVGCPMIFLNARCHDITHAHPKQFCDYVQADSVEEVRMKVREQLEEI